MYEFGMPAGLPRRAADLAILCEIGEALNSSVKLDEILNMILIGVTAGQGLKFNRAFLLLIDERERCLRGSLATGPDDPEEAARVWKDLEHQKIGLRDMLLNYSREAPVVGRRVREIAANLRVPLDDGTHILARCLEHGGAMVVTREQHGDLSSAQVAALLGVDRFALVPILSRNGPVGVLLADNAITRRGIEPGDVDILRLFASHAGTAIEKARLYESVLEEKHELEIAHTELRRNQQTIMNLQRLSDLGEMAAHVAHEIRNPLVTIGGFGRRVLSMTAPDDARRRSLEIIVSEVARLERILVEVLDYARPMKLNAAATRLNDLVRETVEVLSPEIEGFDVDLVVEMDDKVGEIRADAALMKIALLNLLRNALQALPRNSGRRGRIVVRTNRVGPVAQLAVEDNGVGIGAGLDKRIFEPFFTTKASGSGLGLAIASQILKEHGGRVRCENHPGDGASFFLDLPLDNAPREGMA